MLTIKDIKDNIDIEYDTMNMDGDLPQWTDSKLESLVVNLELSFYDLELGNEYEYKQLVFSNIFLDLIKAKGEHSNEYRLLEWFYEKHLPSLGWECYEEAKTPKLLTIRRFKRLKQS